MSKNDLTITNKTETSFYKRKDPKSMTCEELDEYIRRNRPRARFEDNRTVNTSVHSHRNVFNYSFNDGDKNFTKIENIKRSDVNKSITNIHQVINKETINTNNSMNSIEHLSEAEEKYLKFKSTGCVRNNNTCLTSISNQTSNNASETYIKSLNEKIKNLTLENEEAKKNFIEVSELLEKVVIIFI
jgi:exosome complex RNA-binding protein Csl4